MMYQSILPGTKIPYRVKGVFYMFYDNLILPGTKIKSTLNSSPAMFYDNLILPGTKIPFIVSN